MYRIALNTAISGYRKQTRLVKTEDLREMHLNISDAAAMITMKIFKNFNGRYASSRKLNVR